MIPCSYSFNILIQSQLFVFAKSTHALMFWIGDLSNTQIGVLPNLLVHCA